VGSTHSIGSTSDLDRNKAEILQFLCVLVSSTIYTPPHALPYTTNRGLQYLTHSLERRLVLSLLCSWLNTSLSTGTSNWGEQLPYNHLLSKSGEDRRTLVKMSLMSLLVALDHWEMEQPRSPIEPSAGQGSSATSFPPTNSAESDAKKSENAFRYFVSKLVSHNGAMAVPDRVSLSHNVFAQHRTEDFTFILDGILAIMAEHMSVKNNVLPGSKRPVSYITEVCKSRFNGSSGSKLNSSSGSHAVLEADRSEQGMLNIIRRSDLTHAAEQRFRTFLSDSGKTSDVVGYIVLTCLELKDDPGMRSYHLRTREDETKFYSSSSTRPSTHAVVYLAGVVC
jgi:hypothetical protein